MRRTALFLGGLFLATGASLALAGPAQATEGIDTKDRGGYSNSVASVGKDDDRDILIVNNDRGGYDNYHRGHHYGGYNAGYYLGLGFNFQLGVGGSYYPGYGYGYWGW
ncbi:hypothetical protein [Actinoplanes sp. DH11]|uniref:hypothetical protein n=1 Tax=Actinoplanes sp. DH11 TaxID=2857011 RepID=UPI001E29B23D|nr:hypothetical protein [Actinoplanes sp. DH11]